jgi:hypothetical protein
MSIRMSNYEGDIHPDWAAAVRVRFTARDAIRLGSIDGKEGICASIATSSDRVCEAHGARTADLVD